MARTGYHYIPRPDGDFDAWVSHYYQTVSDFWAAQSLDKAQIEAVKDALDQWQGAYASHTAAQAAAEGAAQAKTAARAALESLVRPMTGFLQSYPATTNADRAAFGITVRSGQRTAASTPGSAPLIVVEPAGRLGHTLRLVDTATPTRRAKPRGTVGAEVWVKLADPGTGEGSGSGGSSGPAAGGQSLVPGFTFLTLATRPTIRTEFTPEQGGKTASYMVRWVSTRGDVGPWSEIATSTVAA